MADSEPKRISRRARGAESMNNFRFRQGQPYVKDFAGNDEGRRARGEEAVTNADFEKWWRDDGFDLFGGDLRTAARAAYEAGEIAMKEKAAKESKKEKHMKNATGHWLDSNHAQSEQIAEAIRALPLSGGE